MMSKKAIALALVILINSASYAVPVAAPSNNPLTGSGKPTGVESSTNPAFNTGGSVGRTAGVGSDMQSNPTVGVVDNPGMINNPATVNNPGLNNPGVANPGINNPGMVNSPGTVNNPGVVGNPGLNNCVGVNCPTPSNEGVGASDMRNSINGATHY